MGSRGPRLNPSPPPPHHPCPAPHSRPHFPPSTPRPPPHPLTRRYQAKGEVWWAKDQFVAAGCEALQSDGGDAEWVGASGVVGGSKPWHHGVSQEVCAAKSAALGAAKSKLAAAVSGVLSAVNALGEAASGCESSLGSTYASHYRALWEYATTLDPNNLGYLSTCLEKIKYLLEAILGLDKVVLAKSTYSAALRAKLDKALTALAVCEAKYPTGGDGYGAAYPTAWGEDSTNILAFYGMADPRYGAEWAWHSEASWDAAASRYTGGGDEDLWWTEDDGSDGWFKGASVGGGDSVGVGRYPYHSCKSLVSKIAWLQGEICHIDTKMLAAVAETIKVGTMLAAKAAKCFPSYR
jgi:hypothetical protein